jgi:polar amino acid transport system substrate-binding protein
MFNRFFQPDIDIENEVFHFPWELTQSRDIQLSIRYAGLTHGNIEGSICGSRGVYTSEDVTKLDLVKFENAARLVAAFADGSLDVTFVGVTADRAAAIDFGPTVLELQTTYLVPPKSPISTIAEIDRPGVRIAVPANSAQEAHLRKIITVATLLPVLAEAPQRAIEMMRAGEADAFSHVAPMLSTVQGKLPGARILPGSYFDVPVAIGVAIGRPPAVAECARTYSDDVRRSGFVQQAIDRAGATGMVVAT